MKKGIAFFDFDGTITTKDTLLEFIRFCKGSFNFYLGFLFNSPYLVAMKLKLISNQAAKEKVLTFFFKNSSIQTFENCCAEFSKKILPGLIRPKAIEEIEKLKREGFLVTIVSASPDNWIKGWASQMQIELIATRLEVNDSKLTGKLIGKNCHGKEKVRRILENHVVNDYEEIYAYGDTAGDLHMLKLANHKFYKPFRS